MTSDYVITSIKLCPVVGNNEYIILCDFVGHRMGCFEVLEGGLLDPHPTVEGSKKSHVWIGLRNDWLLLFDIE